MEFAYVFVLIFLSVFGLAALLWVLFKGLLSVSHSTFDITVDCGSDIGGADDFVRCVRRSGCVGSITVLVSEDAAKCAGILEEKYESVYIKVRN